MKEVNVNFFLLVVTLRLKAGASTRAGRRNGWLQFGSFRSRLRIDFSRGLVYFAVKPILRCGRRTAFVAGDACPPFGMRWAFLFEGNYLPAFFHSSFTAALFYIFFLLRPTLAGKAPLSTRRALGLPAPRGRPAPLSAGASAGPRRRSSGVPACSCPR